MPRRTTYAQQDLTTPGGRVEFVLRNVWGGNQHRMAEQIKISQAVISKVARGEQAPGPKLLTAIAADPRINPFWVHEGKGEPLLSMSQERAGGDFSLPTAPCILPGPPEEHAGLLSGLQQSVARADYRPAGYLLVAKSSDRIVRVPKLKLDPGDLLLIEADASVWRENWRVLAGRLVAVRHHGEQGPDYSIVGCSVDTGSARPKFDAFGAVLKPWFAATRPIPLILSELPHHKGRQRCIEVEDESPKAPADPGMSHPTPARSGGTDELSITDVVGFCIRMIRNY